MDETFQAILDSLPPKPPRSKLEPYAELIQELRKRGRSYREIAGILAERCGVTAGTHTVYNFVRVRAAKPKRTRPVTPGAERPNPASRSGPPETAKTREVRQRIQALKEQSPAAGVPSVEKVFHYDENAPLRLLFDSKPKK